MTDGHSGFETLGVPNGIKLSTDVQFVNKINSVAKAFDLNFSRIQFTPDLMPSDIIGSEILDQERQFNFIKGPIFCNVLL